GLNAFTWDLRGRENTAMNVHAMPSGTYTVRLTLGGTSISQPLTVVPDPRAGGTLASEREHATMVVALATMSADINRSLTDLRGVRAQARSLADRAKSTPVATRDAALQALIASTDSLESVLISATLPNAAPLDIMH